MAELNRAVPAGRVPGRRRRERPRRAPGLVLAARGWGSTTRSSRPTRRPAGCSAAGRIFQRLLSWTKPHAPAARGYARLRALRLEQPARRGARDAGHPAGADGRHVVLPVAARRWRRTSRLRRAGRAADPLRLPLDRRRAASTRRRRRRGSTSRRPTAIYRCRVARPGGRRRRAVSRRPGIGDGAHPPLRRRPAGRDVRRPAGAHHRQAELRVRAGHRAAAVGAPARPRRRRRRRSCRSTRRRWSASGHATSSRTRTTSSAAGSASSTRRSTASSAVPDGALTV